jgi:AraC-like DNA-binding protein
VSASQIFLVFVSGLGVIHGLFLAIFLWIIEKGNKTANRILSLLLVVLSFRIGKSVFLEFTENLDVKLIFIGLGTLMAIGPLFYLFSRAAIDKSFQLRNTHLIHFTPSLLGVLFGFWLDKSHLDLLPMALFAVLFISYYLHYLGYLIITYVRFSKQRNDGLSPDTYNLLRLLFYGLLIVWFAYVLNLFDELIPYIVGPVLYSIVAYVISFVVIHKGYIQKIDHAKYKTTQISDEQVEQVYSKVLGIVENDRQYRNADLTLKMLSAKLKVSTQVLSMVINKKSQNNFNNFINQYRVEEAIHIFQNPEYENYTIASIAYEVGFNSISSFNSAFKKHTGKTPQAYRQ